MKTPAPPLLSSLMCLLLLLTPACQHRKSSDAYQLESVSFVNPGAQQHEYLRARIGGNPRQARLDQLGGYSEEILRFQMPIEFFPVRVQMEGITGARSWRHGPVHAGEPARKDVEGKYNLRILLDASGNGFRAEIEPMGVMQARLTATQTPNER